MQRRDWRLATTWYVALAALGIAARLLLFLVSSGSNDIRAWETFAHNADSAGFLASYGLDTKMNHPLPALMYAWGALKISQTLEIPFEFIFKLLPLLADIGTCYLVAEYSRQLGRLNFVAAFALYAASIPAILVSGYHGNTDCLVVFFLTLSLYLLDIRHRYFLGGLAFSAAFNTKLIPLLLLPILLACIRKRAEIALFTLGIIPGLLPYYIGLAGGNGAFVGNVLGYRSIIELWGISYFAWSHPPQSLPSIFGAD